MSKPRPAKYTPYQAGRQRPDTALFVVKFLFMVLVLVSIMLILVSFANTAEAQEPDASVSTADEGTVKELCPFSPGWNLTVLNGSPEQLPPCVTAVWFFDGSTERWFFWGRDNPPYWNDLNEFDITNGYFVYAK